MKTIAVITILVVFGLCQTVRLDFNSEDCNKYLEKFGTVNNPSGQGFSKIEFTGDAAFVQGTTNVQVNLQYSDVDLFNDSKFFGLVKEDGKSRHLS
ncbi:unnamed protein product [Paramecium sonneborni]|uniref:Uncharacterized protein n=1 Tax=Paramecium sonneborni TaxID=65129 RepID=A0A8S1RGW4_9CILI|nr:unnamed protein product [Paramecium sonneborni]